MLENIMFPPINLWSIFKFITNYCLAIPRTETKSTKITNYSYKSHKFVVENSKKEVKTLIVIK